MQFLADGDFVGVSFWIVSVAMIASTVFFLYEGMNVKREWRLSLLIAGLVTLVAGVHYEYMRDYWVINQAYRLSLYRLANHRTPIDDRVLYHLESGRRVG